MPIHVFALNENTRCDQGSAPVHFDSDDVVRNFNDKLSNTAFRHPGWGVLINAEIFRHITLNGYALHSAQINDRHRAFFVVHTTEHKIDCLIIIGFMFDHKHEAYWEKLSPEEKTKLSQVIEEKLIEINHTQAIDQSAAAEALAAAAESSPKRRNPFEARLLSETQKQVLSRLDHTGVLLWGAAGSGKTLLATDWIRRLQPEANSQDALRILYLGPSSELCALVAEAVGNRALIMTPHQLDAYLCDQVPDILKREIRKPADFSVFEQWFQAQYCKTSDPRFISVNKEIAKLNPRTVYDQIINAIIQPVGETLETLREYLSRSEFQREFQNDLVYTVFEAYRGYLITSSEYHEPHLRQFGVFKALLQCTPAQREAIGFDKLAIDELQRMHPWVMYTAFLLLNNREGSQHYFFCGDPYQDLSNRHHSIRTTQQYQNMMCHFGIAHPATPILLTESFRASRAVGQFSNRLLCVMAQYCGAQLREETFGLSAHFQATAGHLHINQYESAIPERYQNDANIMVIIPDHIDLADAKIYWPNMSVFYISDVVGLEQQRVILYGFGEHYAAALRELQSTDIPDVNAPPVFSRKEKKGTEGKNSVPVSEALKAIYSAVTRAIDSVIVVDHALHPAFSALTADIVPTQSSASEMEAACSTLQEWLNTVKKYLANESSATKQEGLRILMSDHVWGKEHVALANEWLKSKKLTIQNPEQCIAFISEIEVILKEKDIAKTLREKISSAQLAVATPVAVLADGAAPAAASGPGFETPLSKHDASPTPKKLSAEVSRDAKKIKSLKKEYQAVMTAYPTLQLQPFSIAPYEFKNPKETLTVFEKLEQMLKGLLELEMHNPVVLYQYIQLQILSEKCCAADNAVEIPYKIILELLDEIENHPDYIDSPMLLLSATPFDATWLRALVNYRLFTLFFVHRKQADLAMPYIDICISLYEKTAEENSQDESMGDFLARCYIDKALLLYAKGDFAAALEYCEKSFLRLPRLSADFDKMASTIAICRIRCFYQLQDFNKLFRACDIFFKKTSQRFYQSFALTMSRALKGEPELFWNDLSMMIQLSCLYIRALYELAPPDVAKLMQIYTERLQISLATLVECMSIPDHIQIFSAIFELCSIDRIKQHFSAPDIIQPDLLHFFIKLNSDSIVFLEKLIASLRSPVKQINIYLSLSMRYAARLACYQFIQNFDLKAAQDDFSSALKYFLQSETERSPNPETALDRLAWFNDLLRWLVERVNDYPPFVARTLQFDVQIKNGKKQLLDLLQKEMVLRRSLGENNSARIVLLEAECDFIQRSKAPAFLAARKEYLDSIKQYLDLIKQTEVAAAAAADSTALTPVFK